MSIKVIGAGFGRTGTLSLKQALEMLGFDKCYHMMEVHLHPTHAQVWKDLGDGIMPDWHELFEGYQASVDWPSCNFWREQMAVYPEAKVILTRRDPEKWYASVMNTIWPSSKAGSERTEPAARLRTSMVFGLIWDGIFEGRMDDKDFVIGQFEKHNQQVIDEVPANKLLVYEPGDGWEPLCTFLDVPVPEADYPRVNSTEDFRAQWDKISQQAKNK